MFQTIMTFCARIQNGRTIPDVYNAAVDETNELCDEVDKFQSGYPPGDDGIIGEAVDCILCHMDLIYQSDPDITETELMSIIVRKLEKWERKYG